MRRIGVRSRGVIAATALIVCAAGITAAPGAVAGRDAWQAAQQRLDYPLFRPSRLLGFPLSKFEYLPCYRGKSRDSVYTSYGAYGLGPRSRKRGFELVEGNPQVCANSAEFTPHGTRLIGRVRAKLGVYCAVPRRCSLAQGVRNGYTLYWRREGTYVQISSARLTLSQLLELARGLRPVPSS